ncbi:MAG: hypothetical protein JNM99_22015 [Verrucomicrobiaceae bacterium]|nr:hypothetical protein [Verrucomicrobiaceae bacterium]
MKTFLLFVLSLTALNMAHAGPRGSASYSVATDSVDAAGRRTASAAYSNDASLGGIAGVSTVAAPAATAKQGYIAQIYEVIALQLAASPTTVNESGTRQITGAQLLDDLTLITVPPASITWSIQSGPLSSISAGGLATADTVYQNTAAVVHGSYLGNSGTLGLTVLDTIPDNFSTYAGDGIGDDWQVFYFGQNDSNAGPLIDLDHDGLPNLLEFACNLNPNTSSVLPTTAVRNGANFEYVYQRSVAALGAGLQFAVQWSDSLNATDWHVTGVSQTVLSDNGTVQQVKALIPAGSATRKFARLSVSAP